jgi:hypothetical protein
MVASWSWVSRSHLSGRDRRPGFAIGASYAGKTACTVTSGLKMSVEEKLAGLERELDRFPI